MEPYFLIRMLIQKRGEKDLLVMGVIAGIDPNHASLDVPRNPMRLFDILGEDLVVTITFTIQTMDYRSITY